MAKHSKVSNSDSSDSSSSDDDLSLLLLRVSLMNTLP
jgi:hypothetical protein